MPTVSWITPVFDRTLEDCVYGNQKGALTVEVLQRIENNVLYLKELFDELGIAYNRDIQIKLDWKRTDYFRIADLRRIERNIKHLRASKLISEDTPDFTLSIANTPLLYSHLNDMEKICLDLERGYDVALKDRLYCGEFWCGYNRDGQFYEIGGGEAHLATGVTFTVEQVGGEADREDTTAIKIIFSQPVTFLTSDSIKLTNVTGEVVSGVMYGESDTYYITLTDVAKQGTVSVHIMPFGDFYCLSNDVLVTVFHERRITVSLLSGAIMAGKAGSLIYAVTTDDLPDGIYEVNLSTPIAGITASTLVLSNNTGYFTLYADETVSSGIYLEYITLMGIASRTFTVAVTVTDYIFAGTFAAADDTNNHLLDDGIECVAKYTTDVTYTIKQVGGAPDTSNTQAINIIFDVPVEYLRLTDISITGITGEISIAELKGRDRIWVLVVDSVLQQGSVSITVNNFGAFHVISPAQIIEVYRNKSIEIGTQIEAAAAEHATKLTLPVTTDGLATGSYEPTFNLLPDGFSFKSLRIDNGTGVLELYFDGSAAAGTYEAQFSIGAATSNVFKLFVTVPDYLYTNTFYPTEDKDAQLFETGAGRAKEIQRVSFTAVQLGGESGIATTTGIRLTFSKDILGLGLESIVLSGVTGAAAISSIEGSGKDWLLQLTAVKQGLISIKIAAFDNYVFVPDTVAVEVYEQRTVRIGEQLAPILAGYPGILQYRLELSGFADDTYVPSITGLPAQSTVKPINVKSGIATLTIMLPACTQGVYDVSIQLLEASVSATYAVTVASAPYTGEFWAADTPLPFLPAYEAIQTKEVQFSIEQIGGVYSQASTTAIRITFDVPVKGFTLQQLTVLTPGVLELGELSGSGTEYIVQVRAVYKQDIFSVSIENFNEYVILTESASTEVYTAKSLYVGEQQGAIAYGLPGKVMFDITANGIEDGTYPVYFTDMPDGLLLPTQLTFSKAAATLIVSTNGEAAPGKYYPRITVDSKTSNKFLLAITN